MGRSLYIYTKNKLLLFITASILIHIGIFSVIKINPGSQVEAEPIRYTVNMRSIKTEPIAVKSEPEAPPDTPRPESPPADPVIQEAEVPPVEAPAEVSAQAPAQIQTPSVKSVSEESQAEAEAVPVVAEQETVVSRNDSGVINFEELDITGAKIPKPSYPDIARRWGHEGTVLMEITISENGAVSDAVIIESSGYAELDKAALKAVLKKWKFPGQGREIVTRKEFEFRLNRD